MYYPYGFDPKEQIEKAAVKRAANLSGAAYCCMFVFDFVLELTLIIGAALAGISMLEIQGLLEDPMILSLMQIFLSMLMFTLPYILVAKIDKKPLSATADFRRPKKGMFLPLVAAGVGMCALGEIATNMFASVCRTIGIEPASSELSFDTGFFGVVLAVLMVAVTPALVEEFAMRGVVMGLVKPYGEGFAIVMSAIMFGLMHRNLVQLPFAFVAGLGLGFIAVKSGSIWTAVTAHFINNLLSIVSHYLMLGSSLSVQNAYYIALNIVTLTVGIAGIVISAARDKDLFVLEKGVLDADGKKKAKWFFSAPFIIIALIITAIQTLMIQVMYS